MTIFIYAFISVLLVSLISLMGVFTLSANEERLRSILLYLVSFSAGALLGDVFIHLLPEYIEEHGFGLEAGLSILCGIICFFVLEQVIHWHHHHSVDCGTEPACEHEQVHVFAITNLIGDAFHNFLDGIVIAAAYLLSVPAGIATTIAVIFHEIPQEIGDFGVLIHGGFSRKQAIKFNLLVSLTALLGVILVYPLSEYIDGIAAFLVPFAAGGFIYIAGSDLIPEVHSKDPSSSKAALLKLGAFLLGIIVMAGLLSLEFLG